MGEKKGNNLKKILIDPFQRFLQIEASGGIILLIATIASLVWANSKWGEFYIHFWETHLDIHIGSFILSKSFLHWINDGLMAIFFFVVGLEIKRELIAGELSSLKKASLPIMAAIGGMLAPALFYSFLNKSPETASGWGTPMATDIAFSLGILSLLGKRVPLSLKVFLVAFAIVDDLGAVLVITLFYSSDIHLNSLLIALSLFIFLILFNQLKIRSVHIYMVIGWGIWYFFLKSGIHPSIAGVLIAFTIPVFRKIRVTEFRNKMDQNLLEFCFDEDCMDEVTLTHGQLAAIDNMESEIEQVQSPIQKLEHKLHSFVTYIVMPLFALANAGVVIQSGKLADLFNPLSMNIQLSLVGGKLLGIFMFTWLAIRFGISTKPKGVKWIHFLGLALLGGIGFTMSLFIANLAFPGSAQLVQAKIGILLGSLAAGILGFIILRLTLKAKKK